MPWPPLVTDIILTLDRRSFGVITPLLTGNHASRSGRERQVTVSTAAPGHGRALREP
ncbi:hypothetical protein [Streptomyces sp. TR06-5]|uniref:hypothetical protein n=1 Tax=unclassified Streptomyces TaxID=2593676 RepID=UPI0039A07EAF